MGGKASILLVLGFSLIFLIVGNNFSGITTRAVDNFADYYDSTMAYNIAVSGTNILANKFFIDSNLPDKSDTMSFQGGLITYTFSTSGTYSNVKEIEVIGTFGDISKTIKVYLQPSKFSKFAYFSVIEGNIWWKSQDTVWGPMHVQEDLQVSGSPVFMGKTSSKNGITYDNGPGIDDPKFYGGYTSGVDMDLAIDGIEYLDSAAVAGGKQIDVISDSTATDTVYITFQSDSVNVKYGANEPDSTYLSSDYAPNGVIMAKGLTVRIQGTVSGQYTVATIPVYHAEVKVWGCTRWKWWGCQRYGWVTQSYAYYSGGDVFIDDDIVYESDPRTNPSSSDLLGIVADGDIMITNNSANNSDINIHAALYSQNGGFGAEDYSSRPISGDINLLGGVVQYERKAVGTFNSTTQTNISGFSKKYKYDDRLLLVSPPSFPGTGSFEIVSWFE
ncbi:MAG: hypothetical protein PVH88_09535 [Ignavibacteria bacterium]|jgi:hypothetical protein